VAPTEFSRYLGKVLFLVGTDRRKLALLLPLYLISSAADLVGIGLLVALITALKDPETLLNVAGRIPVIAGFVSSSTQDALTVMLSCAVFLAYAGRTAIVLYVSQLTLKITFLFGARFRSLLMGVYQKQSYDKFIQRNSSEYIHNVQTLAGQFVTYTVQPILKIIGDGLLTLLIIGYLAFKDPFVLAVLLLLMSIAGYLYDRAFRKKIATYGRQENSLSTRMIKSVAEGLNGYRESHIFGIAGFFRRAVADAALQLAHARIRSHLITAASRYLLEFIVVISVILVIITTIAIGRDKGELLTTLALFLVASMRLVPAANQIVTNIGNLRYGLHAVDILHRDITGAGTSKVDLDSHDEEQQPAARAGDEAGQFGFLELRDVGFRYVTEGSWVLDSVNLRIDRYDIVGIVGLSGSGKSTLIALILGLLTPQRGKVVCDGKDLAERQYVKEWHKKVAFLPQEVFLVDDTVARNVALGVDENGIDADKLRDALTKARLAEMVERTPEGIHASVGEKGLWVSGGQRQRIALARAFYYGSEVLILDESTSALDAETADEIISELRQLKGKVTIVVITHQDALLALCNKIYRLEGGRLLPLPADTVIGRI